MSLINFETLEKAIKNVEDCLEGYNETEKDLIIQQLINKRNVRKQQQKASDIVGGYNLKDMVKRMMKEE